MTEMGPKKGKDVTDDNYWRTSIETALLDDQTWSCKVIMLEAAGSDHDRTYLNKFETFAVKEKRCVVKNICKTETVFMVNQLGSESKVRDESNRVFEEAQAYIKEKKEIPPENLALVIKHLILKMKDEYLFVKRQKLEVKQGMHSESMTMVNRAEVRGTVNVKPPLPDIPPPSVQKSKAKKGDIDKDEVKIELDDGKKYNTQLRLRGEEWRDKVYVEDFPVDGPNLYIAITGFTDPFLPVCLLKIGVPLTAVIQIRIDLSSVKIPSSFSKATKRGQSQTEILTDKTLKFWDDLQQLRIAKHSADDLKNTAFVVFSPPYWESEDLSGESEKIYDELCYLMYDIHDLDRQHAHFIENIEIISIPDLECDIHYQDFYNDLIDKLPLECVTIYSVLDSILQTVTKCENICQARSFSEIEPDVKHQTPQKKKSDIKIEKAEILVTNVFDSLCPTEDNENKKSYRITYGEESEKHRDPIIINFGDSAKSTTFHLGDINLDNIVYHSLHDMPIHQLWLKHKPPAGDLEAKINFHINVLLSCFERDDVESTELSRLLHILACRKLYNNRSSLHKGRTQDLTINDYKKVYLKRSVLAAPISKCPSMLASSGSFSSSNPSIVKSENISDLSTDNDPESRRIKFLFNCPDIRELVSAAEIATERPISHLIDDFEYFEDFSSVSAFQVLLESFNKFNCIDYKYCEVTDCIVMMFFNSHDKDGIARNDWRCHIPTALCLQDFFDFVLEEHYQWIQKEDEKYYKTLALTTQTENKDVFDPFAAKTCVANNEVDIEMLIEGSLKYEEFLQVEESSVDITEPGPISKKSMSPTDFDSKSSNKNKSSIISTPKTNKLAGDEAAKSSDAIEISKKPFTGYDLGDRRVEAFGKDNIYYSKDGSKICSMYYLLIPINYEWIVLNAIPGNGNNEIWVHRVMGEFSTPKDLEICESFRISTKDQAMINVKKTSYQIPLPRTIISEKKKVNLETSQSARPSLIIPEPNKIVYFHSLCITWPNGLVIETVYEEYTSIISHIKQTYLTSIPGIDEEMRCISMHGEAIIFKPSGVIEVLRPDGSFYKITKYVKQVVVPDIADDETVGDTSSNKSKTKEKVAKRKEKLSKTSSKSTKSTVTSTENPESIPSPDYELVIEEYEVINTCGLRQKCVNNQLTDIDKMLIRTATDYCLGEVFSRRMDGTNILLNKDGVQVVTFYNGTRIISYCVVEDEEVYPEWTEDEIAFLETLNFDIVETVNFKSKSPRSSMSQKSYVGTYNNSIGSGMSRKEEEYEEIEEEENKEEPRTDGYISIHMVYTVEHKNFATVTVDNTNGKVTIESPNGTSVAVDQSNQYTMKLDSLTTAKFNGRNLHINYEACPKCKSNTTFDIRISNDEIGSDLHLNGPWLKMKDSFCKKILVNEEGGMTLLDEPCSHEMLHGEDSSPEEGALDVDEIPNEYKSEASITSHGKCREMYMAKTVKFFVMHRDLKVSELVHRTLLEEYKRACRWQPWCSINTYDTFGDHRRLVCLLSPIQLTESEKWLMDSKLSGKPKYLTYKDLRKDPGKGFYHWMRPYERFTPSPIKPENVLPARLPRAFVHRTLEQQWCEKERQNLGGAKELLRAILKYRHVMEKDCQTVLHVPIVDPRTEDERRTDEILQALGKRIYDDLKSRLSEDVQSRAKATITTEPLIPSKESSFIGEEETIEQSECDEEREIVLKELDSVVEMSPNLKRYWRRRAEELKEEHFYRYLLREGCVPPYFRNILGGAIWWEMNNMAGEAVTHAERRKMSCVCGEEATNDSHVHPRQ